MTSQVYRQLIQILNKWPVDSTKKGRLVELFLVILCNQIFKRKCIHPLCNSRDLGEFIRKEIAENFPLGESSKVDTAHWSKIAGNLDFIAGNGAYKKYPRTRQSTATGLTAEECQQIVSTDFLNHLKQEGSLGFFKAKK